MLTSDEMLEIRHWAVDRHRNWKTRQREADLIAQGDWYVAWPDLTITQTRPLVENIYVEALEDKVGAAAAITPFYECPPRRGTKRDDAEMSAQKRRRAFISFAHDSRINDKLAAWYYDWWHSGAMYAMPWKDWSNDGQHPHLIRYDPRHAFPISHDSNDRLTSIFFSKQRRLVDLQQEWGKTHPALTELESRFAGRTMPTTVEELTWADTHNWGVWLIAAPEWGANSGDFRYVPPTNITPGTEPLAVALVPQHPHRLDGCPVVEKAKRSPDGEIRSPLYPMIDNLRVANTFTARIIEDLEQQVGAPTIYEGITNIEDWGPGAFLEGDGTGNARVESVRHPVNFEAVQHVAQQLDSARNVGAFPQQRSGDPGASVTSAKGTLSVMGAFNTQQAWAQRDMADFLRQALTRTANFDQEWCGGDTKEITGWDDGEIFTDRYDPATFWKDDWRLEVGFHSIGLDEQQHLTRLAIARSNQGLSRRSFMKQSGMVDNPLAEEREIALETVTDSLQVFVLQQAEAGNKDPMLRFAELVDSDKETARSAALKTIKEMATTPGPEAGAAPGGGGDPFAAISADRSLAQGGIPGNAELLPPVEGDLAALLGGGMGRAAAQIGPGATGPS